MTPNLRASSVLSAMAVALVTAAPSSVPPTVASAVAEEEGRAREGSINRAARNATRAVYSWTPPAASQRDLDAAAAKRARKAAKRLANARAREAGKAA